MNLNATILGQLIAFIIFVWICMKYVWNPLISIVEARQKKIADDLQLVKQSKIKSEEMNQEALVCLKQAKIKSEEILKNAYECKIKILCEAKQEAKNERDRILSQASLQINQEREYAFYELRKKIGILVIKGIEKVMNESINNSIDYNFINEIIDKFPYED